MQVKCTNCGASLNVDPNQRSAVCPYCRAEYIVEQAIKEYNITINGDFTANGAIININGNNMLERANQFAKKGDFPKAIEYFNGVLDIDVNSKDAVIGIQKIQNALNKYVYFKEDTKNGLLELKKGRLILTNSVGPTLYELSRIFELGVVSKSFFSNEKSLQFTYDGIPKTKVVLDTSMANKWFVLIEDAKMGKYQKMINLDVLYDN